MIRIRLVLSAVVVVVLAATASAAGGGSVTSSLSPNKVLSAATLSIKATGPFSGASGIPKSVVITVQKGFKSSAKAVKVLCTRTQANSNSCPAKSKVGSGTAVATGTFGFFTQSDTVSLSLYLGTRQKKSDIASIVIVGTDSVANQTAHAVGRLFVLKQGGLELLFNKFPNVSLPAGTNVTFNSLQLQAGASRVAKKHKHQHTQKVRYSLITNPPTCHSSWTGSLTLTFSNGTFVKTLHTPCRKH